MTPDQRNYLSMCRLTQYYDIMRTTLFVFTGLAAIIEFGPSGYSAPLTVLAITATAYGILGGSTAIADVNNLRDDMDEEAAKTKFGKALKARNVQALNIISAAMVGLIGIAELFAIWT